RRAHLFALVQQLGGRLELLMLEQPADQRVARVFFLAFDTCRRLGTRQQQFRFDVDQGRGHHQELACDIEIQLLHQVNRVEILRRDERNGNVVDVHLVFPDEVKQQIERPREVIELDGERVGGRFEVLRLIHQLAAFNNALHSTAIYHKGYKVREGMDRTDTVRHFPLCPWCPLCPWW